MRRGRGEGDGREEEEEKEKKYINLPSFAQDRHQAIPTVYLTLPTFPVISTGHTYTLLPFPSSSTPFAHPIPRQEP